MDIREKRKWDHIREALADYDHYTDFFSQVRLYPDSASTGDVSRVQTDTKVFGKKLEAPLLINAMTGGAEGLEIYNRIFSSLAGKHGLAMAVGSQKSAVNQPHFRDSFRIARKVNPNGVLFANVSALESLETMRTAVEMLEADAIQLHVNHGQELSMEEGDRDFSRLLHHVEEAVRSLPVPVILKEVGSGISPKAARAFYEVGIRAFDIGGFGGTNFARIEEKRRGQTKTLLGEFGIPTPVSLMQVRREIPDAWITATGGIRNSSQVVKSLVMGANLVGMAGELLHVYTHKGERGLEETLLLMKEEIKKIMVVLGANNLQELGKKEYVLLGEVALWMKY